MSKILEATCLADVVKIGAITVPNTTILSQGTKASTGLLFMEEGEKTYLASNASDISDILEKLDAVITKIKTVLTALDSSLGSTQTANIVLITTAAAELLAIKDNLK